MTPSPDTELDAKYAFFWDDEPDDWQDEYEAWLASQPFDEDAWVAWADEMDAREEQMEPMNGKP